MDFYERQLGYRWVQGKKLRRGFSTGSAATAAAKAAMEALLHGKTPKSTKIKLPNGDSLDILIEDGILNTEEKSSSCTVRKFSGDDIDVTSNCLITAKIILSGDKISLESGTGVGRVTKKGLKIPPGQGAINPVPQQMIIENLRQIYPIGGACVEISVKDGEKIALKTFNPRLGIEGGISILGTTGIVEPMSEESLKISLREELFVKQASTLALTFGNMGEKSLMQLGVPSQNICICSNFIGYILREAAGLPIQKILIGGHIGKLVKLSGGIFNTHSHVADAKNEIIAAHLALEKAPHSLIQRVMNSVTAEETLEYIKQEDYLYVIDILANVAADKARQHVYGQMVVETIMFDLNNNIIGKSDGALSLIKEMMR